MAEQLQDTPVGGYKSQMVVATTYAFAGLFLDYLKEPRGDRILEKGIQVLAIVQERQGTDKFDDKDWDDTARIYYYRAATLHEPKDSPSAVDFYQRSFQAEASAYVQLLCSKPSKRRPYTTTPGIYGIRLFRNAWYEKVIEFT